MAKFFGAGAQPGTLIPLRPKAPDRAGHHFFNVYEGAEGEPGFVVASRGLADALSVDARMIGGRRVGLVRVTPKPGIFPPTIGEEE